MTFNKDQLETAALGMETVDDVMQNIRMKKGENYYRMLKTAHNVCVAVRMSNAIFFTVVPEESEANKLMEGIGKAQFPLMAQIYMDIARLGQIGEEHVYNCVQSLMQDNLKCMEIIEKTEEMMEKQRNKKEG